MKKTIYRNIVDEKALTKLSELKVKCKCGHTMIIPVYMDKTICTNCGSKVLNNTLLHFKYKMRKAQEDEK